MRLLLVEDDELLGDAVRAGLMQQGYAIEWVTDGAAAELALERGGLDLVLLDLNLPFRGGLDVLKRARMGGDRTPVLVLTARDSVSDRVRGLDAGADDYLVKPFSLEELYARVRALLRRHAPAAEARLLHGDIELDPMAHSVHRRGEPVELTPREFALLKMLLENAGRVVSRAQLEHELYGWEGEVASNAVEVHVHHLRKKLGGDLIHTLRGVGYMVPKVAR